MSNKLPFTTIVCSCGSTINTQDALLIAKIDKLHGSIEHNLLIMELRKLRITAKIRFTPPELTENDTPSDLRL